jgi:hypothetical protein
MVKIWDWGRSLLEVLRREGESKAARGLKPDSFRGRYGPTEVGP